MDKSRRRFVALWGSAVAAPLAGCGASSSGEGSADVVAGPGGRPVFEPAVLSVSAGDAVTWYFESAGHNVCGRPADHDQVALPPDAEPFASYGPDESPRALVPQGETYTHAFDAPGTYVYVCIPHAPDGMTGRIRVT